MDKAMENINYWTKTLPLQSDEESWQCHSPNITAAKKCATFEELTSIKHCDDKDPSELKPKQCTAVPRAQLEKSILH